MIRKLLLFAIPVFIYALLQVGIECCKVILNKEYQQDYLNARDRQKRKHKIITCIILIITFLASHEFMNVYYFKTEKANESSQNMDILTGDNDNSEHSTSTGEDEKMSSQDDIKTNCSIEDMILDAKDQYFTVEQLADFSSSELRLIRNGIFAYEGRTFREEDLNEFYSNFSWYTPKFDKQVVYLDLNHIQRANVDLIKDLEKIKKTSN